MRTIVLVLILSVVLVSCGSKDKNKELTNLKSQYEALGQKIKALEKEIGKTGPASNTEVMIVTTEIAPKPFNHYVEVQGRVDGEENVTVTSKAPGVLTTIFVKEGDVVRKGQKLAELDKSVLLQNLQELKSIQIFYNDLYEKQKKLWEQKIGSELQYLTAKNTKEGMDNKIKSLEEQIDMYNITSPINGTVEEIPVKVGQMIAPGMTAFRVVNFSSIKVIAEVAESYSTKIHTGDDVLVTFPDNDEKIDAKISFSSKFINPINRTFLVEVKLAGGKIEYRANMISVIKIIDYTTKEAIVLPLNIIQSDNVGKYVFVLDESTKTAKKRMVTTGRSYNGEVEIVSGLVKGDKVITVGYQNVEDGVKGKYLNNVQLTMGNEQLKNNDSYMGMSRSFTGISHSFMGMSRSFMGMSRSFMGMSRSFMGMSRSFMGMSHSFMGMSHSFMGMSHSFMGGIIEY